MKPAAPWAAGAFAGSAVGGMTMQKLGRRVLQAGLVVEAAGLLGLYGVLGRAGAGVSTLDLACSFAMACWLPRRARQLTSSAEGTGPAPAAEPELVPSAG